MLLAVFICAAFLSGSHVAYAVNESLLVSAYQQPSKIKGTVIDAMVRLLLVPVWW